MSGQRIVLLIVFTLTFYCAGISSAGEEFTRISEKKLFKISYVCHHEDMKIKEFHSGDLIIHTVNNDPVTNATITIDFAMPEHGGHKAMRRPEVSEHLGEGRYKVKSINFQMPGHWQMKVNVQSDKKDDTAVFDLMVNSEGKGDSEKHMH